MNENDAITTLTEESSTLGAIGKSSTTEVEKTIEEVGREVSNYGNARRSFRRGGEEEEGLNISIGGPARIFIAVHYMVDGSVGVRSVHKKGVCFDLGTGEVINIIHRDELPYG